MLPRALEALLHVAVTDVLRALERACDVSSRRLAHFIQLRYQDQATAPQFTPAIGLRTYL